MESTNHQIKTDDLAFSAYLKMKGYHLIKLDKNKSKNIFIFANQNDDLTKLQMDFVNSEFLTYYNELRNLKKIM